MPPDPYQPVETPPIPTTTGEAAAQISRMSALDRLRSLLGSEFSGATVTTDYGGPTWGTLKPHTGIDFAAAEGTPIREPIGGTVEKVWHDSIGGNQVAIKTPQGYREVYAHLSAIPAFIYTIPGAGVPQGGLIGYVGQTGMASGPHLHYEIAKPSGVIGTIGGTVDPLAFIGEFASSGAALGPTGPDGPAPTPRPMPGFGSGANAVVDSASKLGTRAAAKGVPILDIPGALGSIAGNVAQLTGDLTNPQTWASIGLTLAAVGLIGAGVVLYAGSAAPRPRLPV